jgi:hypothetical protein
MRECSRTDASLITDGGWPEREDMPGGGLLVLIPDARAGIKPDVAVGAGGWLRLFEASSVAACCCGLPDVVRSKGSMLNMPSSVLVVRVRSTGRMLNAPSVGVTMTVTL